MIVTSKHKIHFVNTIWSRKISVPEQFDNISQFLNDKTTIAKKEFGNRHTNIKDGTEVKIWYKNKT